METPIHYVRTSDGCAIAYTVTGDGPPLVYLQPYSHQQIDQTHPVLAPWYRRLAGHHTLVRLDARGFGLSDRDPAKISLEGQVLDLEAVVERLGLEPFALVGISGQGYTAVAYAARHPEHVSRMIIWGTPAGGYRDSRTSAIVPLADLDSELVMDAQARWIAGDQPAQISEWTEYIRVTTDASALRSYGVQLTSADVLGHLASIPCPALVVHPALHRPLLLSETSELASRLPDATFVAHDARVYPHLGPDVDANARLIEQFFGVAAGPASEIVGNRAVAELTQRELDVLALIAAGASNQKVAEELSLSVSTVDRHVANIYGKTGVHNRAEATRWAVAHGVVPAEST